MKDKGETKHLLHIVWTWLDFCLLCFDLLRRLLVHDSVCLFHIHFTALV